MCPVEGRSLVFGLRPLEIIVSLALCCRGNPVIMRDGAAVSLYGMEQRRWSVSETINGY